LTTSSRDRAADHCGNSLLRPGGEMSLREALIPEALPGLITALQAKLKPARDAMALESRINNPYGNVIAVREAGR
jgi:hypothetical protein